MIEIVIGAGVLAAAAAIGRIVHARRKAREKQKDVPPRKRRIGVGDVLLYMNSEVWLAGSLLLDEDGFVMELFRSPQNPHCEWVLTLDLDGAELFFLKCADIPKGAPYEIHVGDVDTRLYRAGRGKLVHAGEELPSLGQVAAYAIYRGAGGRVAVTLDTDTGDRLALSGSRIERSMLDDHLQA